MQHILSEKNWMRRKHNMNRTFKRPSFQYLISLCFQGIHRDEDVLRPKALDSTYPSNEPYNGERQVIKTLTSDPIKLYTQIPENFDTLRAQS